MKEFTAKRAHYGGLPGRLARLAAEIATAPGAAIKHDQFAFDLDLA
jgi:hypothetical protein